MKSQNNSQTETRYFAYGSNMSKQQMLRRTGTVPTSVVARLDNYPARISKSARRTRRSMQPLFPKANAFVYGVAYQCLPQAMLKLDHFEGVAENCYRRESLVVTAQNGESLNCIVYFGYGFLH